jgi:hypothetical protein
MCRHSQWESKLVGSRQNEALDLGRDAPFYSQIPPWGYANEAESYDLTYGEVSRVSSGTFAWIKTKKARAVSLLPRLKRV